MFLKMLSVTGATCFRVFSIKQTDGENIERLCQMRNSKSEYSLLFRKFGEV